MKLNRTHKKYINFFIFIMPALIGYLLFTIYPLIRSLILSFTDKMLIGNQYEWVGFSNYVKAITIDNYFFPSIMVTTIFTFIIVPISIIISLGLALVLSKKFRMSGFFRIVYYIPSLVPAVALSLMFQSMFDPSYGFINKMLISLGVSNPPLWLASEDWAMPTLVIMSMWGFGGRMIIFLAALRGVPNELYEAAETEGAGRFTKFFKITLPMISPMILYNVLMAVIGGLQAFTESFISTGGNNRSTRFIVLYIYQMAYNQPYMMGYASAMSWMLFIYIVLIVGSIFLMVRNKIFYQNEARKS